VVDFDLLLYSFVELVVVVFDFLDFYIRIPL
jgi:hypothetical protein